MASRSFDRRQLSRSKLELFLECPRCFYEDVALGNARPGPGPECPWCRYAAAWAG